jgi:hypothetical protein
MNISVFTSENNVFTNCEYIKGYAFKMVALRGKSAHLAYVLVALRAISNRYVAFFTKSHNNCDHFDQSISLSPLIIS